MSLFWNFAYPPLRRSVQVAVVCCLATTLWHKQCLAQTVLQPGKISETSEQAVATNSNSSSAAKRTPDLPARTGMPEPQLIQRIEELRAKSLGFEAIPLAQELLERSEKSYGTGHTNTAIALNRLGEIYYEDHNFTNSASLHTRALEIREKWLEPEHPDTATSLENLAKARFGLGDYAGGLPLSERSLSIREKVFGPQHPKTAVSLGVLATFYCTIGDYVKAEPLAKRSLQIYTEVMGSEHKETAFALNKLGLLYSEMGHYSKAEPLFQKSLSILTQLLGPEHQRTLVSLNNLASLYDFMGEYAKADPLFDQSLAAFEKLLHSEPAKLATALDSRAVFYCKIGDYEKALSLSERALKLREQAMGPEHPDTALSLLSLATLRELNGDYGKTEALFQRGLKIYEKVFGTEHPETAKALSNLMWHYMNVGNYSNAIPLCVRSLRIREKSLGPEHPDTAVALSNLGMLMFRIGGHKHAEPHFERSLAISEKAYGLEHPNTATTLRYLIFLKLGIGKTWEAMGLANKYKSAAESAIFNILAFAPERQRMQSQGTLSFQLISVLAAVGSNAELSESILRVKGVVMDSILEDELTALAAKDPAVIEALDELRATARRLTQAQLQPFNGSNSNPPVTISPERGLLAQRVEALQKQLARNVTSLGRVRRGSRVTVAEVQGTLAKDTVLIEFVRYGHFLGKSNFEARYGAVVIGNRTVALGGADVGEPIWLALDSSRLIEQNIQEYWSMMRGTKKGDPVLLQSLYTQLFEAIQSRLPKGVTKLIISADARLNQKANRVRSPHTEC